jgi:hypothetical protein
MSFYGSGRVLKIEDGETFFARCFAQDHRFSEELRGPNRALVVRPHNGRTKRAREWKEQ